MGMDSQVVLTSFVYEMDAQVLVLELQSVGIDAMVRKDDCGGSRPGITSERGIEVLVDRSDLMSAQELLAQVEAEKKDASAQSVQTKQISWKHTLAACASGILIGVLLVYVWGCIKAGEFRPVGGSVSLDRNGDGEKDIIWTYNFDGVSTGGKSDDNFDGKWDVWWTSRKGLIVSGRVDTDRNGFVDVEQKYSNGVIVTEVVRPNGSDVAISRSFFRDGVLSTMRLDKDEDGTMDIEKKFDAFGRQIKSVALDE